MWHWAITHLGWSIVIAVSSCLIIYFLSIYGSVYLIAFVLTHDNIPDDKSLRKKRRKIECIYGISTMIAPPKLPHGKENRLIISCPQCRENYSLFGYGRCPKCKYKIPFTEDENYILYNLKFRLPVEISS